MTRVALCCAGDIGLGALRAFLAAHPGALAGVCSYRVEPPQEGAFDEIRALAAAHGVDFVEGDAAAALTRWAPDFAFAIKWRTMIPPAAIAAVRHGLIVFHASLLPKYRGFAPIPWPIINGERETGVTMFYAAAEVDSGDVIDQRRIAITGEDDAATLETKVAENVAAMLVESYPALAAGTAPRRPQDQAAASYCVWRDAEDGRIDWRAPARRIHDLVRGLTRPYPGAFSEIDGRDLLVWKTTLASGDRRYVGAIPGKVERILPGVAVNVLTGDGIIGLVDVQLEGEPPRKAWEVITRLKTRLG